MLNHLGSRYRLSLPDGQTDPGKLLFETARASGAQIRGFHTALRSLEDIFLEAVE